MTDKEKFGFKDEKIGDRSFIINMIVKIGMQVISKDVVAINISSKTAAITRIRKLNNRCEGMTIEEVYRYLKLIEDSKYRIQDSGMGSTIPYEAAIESCESFE